MPWVVTLPSLPLPPVDGPLGVHNVDTPARQGVAVVVRPRPVGVPLRVRVRRAASAAPVVVGDTDRRAETTYAGVRKSPRAHSTSH